MNRETVKILAVEDNPVDVMRLKDALRQDRVTRFEISSVESLSEAKQILGEEGFQLVLLDLGLPDSQGIETFLEMRKLAADIPIVVLSGLYDETLAIEAVAKGGQDYLCKDSWDSRLIVRSLNYAIERHKILNQCKRAEELARESENRFRAVFEGSEDWIFLKDRHLRFVQVNPAMAADVGRDASELVGRKDDEIFGTEAAESFKEIDERALAGQTVEGELAIPMNGVSVVWSYSISPLRDAEGKITGIFGIVRDVTGRKQKDRNHAPFAEEYSSKAMRSTLSMARRAAPLTSTVLLLGESGSGKDYVAKYIHDNSTRTNGPYFAVNCAAISSTLAESELFGHEKGAFTGAAGRKRGMLELAEGGTLLLNEIGDLPLLLQAKLLTFLDTKKFTRVGGEREISVNARIIAATNRDLEKAVEEGTFRHDLFYRFSVIKIKVPPLRERMEDIPALAKEIVSRLATDMQLKSVPPLDAAMMEALAQYHWPGNVRELRNVLERALIVSEGKRCEILLPSPSNSRPRPEVATGSEFRGRTLREVTDEITRAMCLDALEQCNGNKREAARILGIARDSLYRYLKQFGILTNGC